MDFHPAPGFPHIPSGTIRILLLCTALLLTGCDHDDRSGTLAQAKSALARADEQPIESRPVNLYREAEQNLQLAELEVVRQNAKFPWFRKYEMADSLLRNVISSAGTVVLLTQAGLADAHNLRLQQSAELAYRLQMWRDTLDSLGYFREYETLWREADARQRSAQYLAAADRERDALEELVQGRERLDRLQDTWDRQVEQDQNAAGVWDEWVEQTLASGSKSRQPVIVVSKQQKRLWLVQPGKENLSFSCRFGWNASVQKRMQGDGATPEGCYQIKKLRNNGSKYHRALLLNYPNEGDVARFRSLQQTGRIPRNASPGGLIEIHGGGGETDNWTDGCIALNDEDIDRLMPLVSVGTPVVIVRRTRVFP